MPGTTPAGRQWTTVGRWRKGKVPSENRKGQVHPGTDERLSHRGGRTGTQEGDCEATAGGTHTHGLGRLGRG
eukprot:13012791-Heterocapsa_arctica.AAC.1